MFLHRCLVECTRRHGVEVHAYVFMSNHVHLLATSAFPGAMGRAIQSLGRRYVSYFNYLHERTGTLWEGRYKSNLVTTDRYFLTCMKYVEMNPVRAGLVESPGSFLWSSYRFHADGKPDDLVTPHALYLGLGKSEASRRSAYRHLFDSGEDPEDLSLIRERIQTGWALGDEPASVELERAAGRRLNRETRGRKKQQDHADTPGQLELT